MLIKNKLMTNIDKMKKWPSIVALVFLLLSVLNWPYGFYTLLRIVITAIAIYYAYNIKDKSQFYLWFFVCVAIIFNPIIPIYLYSRLLWGIINLIIFIFLIIFLNREMKLEKKKRIYLLLLILSIISFIVVFILIINNFSIALLLISAGILTLTAFLIDRYTKVKEK